MHLSAAEGWLQELLQASQLLLKPLKTTPPKARMLLVLQVIMENTGDQARWARHLFLGSLVVDKTRGSNLAPSCQEDRLLQRPDMSWIHHLQEETMVGSLRIVI